MRLYSETVVACIQRTKPPGKRKKIIVLEQGRAEEGMIAVEAKAARKRKKLKHEDHKDDCGSNLGPLQDVAMTAALVEY